ncbi:hypothetical protein BDZ94DRAFT_1322965 [Collybia nuda]|uniref:Amidohydrolase-related domain-containing protein n=1 Tax=Collybia nuda TaxID=64659 RepID=A0A9P5Y436_9AGAR|nr:hypothetical protein BDZ94DRAFT_1322965 [Collybia nuda]
MVSTNPTPSPSQDISQLYGAYHILAGQIFDSHACKFVPNQVISVDGVNGTILGVQDHAHFTKPKDEDFIDLRHLTVLPGFVDAHVHLFLHEYSGTSWGDQLTKESLTERSLRAGVHARKTLMAGFTTVRDLGTEGAADADIALRKCLAYPANGKGPIIPGPRYYCTTRAIVSTGSYGPKSTLYPSKSGIEGVTGAEIADGVDGCVMAVRRQIGAGADWIKIYGDYRNRSQISDVSPDIAGTSFPLFNRDELKAMIDTAHSAGVKVAVHTNTASVIETVLELGADTIEHGQDLLDTRRGGDGTDVIRKWTEPGKNTTWVPTLAVFYSIAKLGLPGAAENWEKAKKSFQAVLRQGKTKGAITDGDGIKIVCGGDTGAFPHGENGLEMVMMRKLGAGWDTILRWATLAGWECIRGMEWEGERGKTRVKAIEEGARTGAGGKSALERNVPFGAIRTGWAADLVGIEGVLDGDVDAFEKAILTGVRFVVKGGTVYKRDGKEVL